MINNRRIKCRGKFKLLTLESNHMDTLLVQNVYNLNSDNGKKMKVKQLQ